MIETRAFNTYKVHNIASTPIKNKNYNSFINKQTKYNSVYSTDIFSSQNDILPITKKEISFGKNQEKLTEREQLINYFQELRDKDNKLRFTLIDLNFINKLSIENLKKLISIVNYEEGNPNAKLSTPEIKQILYNNYITPNTPIKQMTRTFYLIKMKEGNNKQRYTPEQIKHIINLPENLYSKFLFFANIQTNKNQYVYNYDDITSFLKLPNKCIKDISEHIEENSSSSVPLNKNRILNSAITDRSKSLEAIDIVREQKHTCLNNTDLYVNSDADDTPRAVVIDFFKEYYRELLLFAGINGKDGLDCLLRMRFDDAEEYLDTYSDMEPYEKIMYRYLANSSDVYGRKFLPKDRIRMIDLVQAYSDYEMNTTKMKTMIDDNCVVLSELNMDLISKIFKTLKIPTDNLSEEEIMKWDLKNMPLLAKELSEDNDNNNYPFFNPHTVRSSYTTRKMLKDIIKTASSGNFDKLISDTSNYYGQTNARTKNQFIENKMNYDAWKNANHMVKNVDFVSIDKNKERLQQISKQISEDIESLRSTKAKVFIDKILSSMGTIDKESDKFFIADDIYSSKEKLLNFTENIIIIFSKMWERAEQNTKSDNTEIRNTAQNTLTIKNHLQQRCEDIKLVKDITMKKELNYTIKMWDRVPQRDLFQGNFTTCCIGMGEVNSRAMSQYLLYTAFNMIEVVDKKTGSTICNALCYYIKTQTNKNEEQATPCFIIDNIEIKNSAIPSKDVQIKLRNAIFEYAKNVNEAVTGNRETKILMSNNYNDVYTDDLPKVKNLKANLIGRTDSAPYLDFFGGWANYFSNGSITGAIECIPKEEEKPIITFHI